MDLIIFKKEKMNTCEIHIDSGQSKVVLNHALASIKKKLSTDKVIVNYIEVIWKKTECIILIDSEDEIIFNRDDWLTDIKTSTIYINWKSQSAVRVYKSLIKKILINDIEI